MGSVNFKTLWTMATARLLIRVVAQAALATTLTLAILAVAGKLSAQDQRPFFESSPNSRLPIPRADGTEGGFVWRGDDHKPNGPFASFFSDGSLKLYGHYRNNQRHGLWDSYSMNGGVVETIQYDMGAEVYRWKYGGKP